MERVGPIPPPHAAQSIARLIPLGQGWVLEPLETGFLLKTLLQGAEALQVRVTGEEAQALRQGEVTPEQMAQRHGVVPHHLPPGAVTVAFSDEALRLSGRGSNTAQGGDARVPQEQPPGQGSFLPRAGIIGAALIALLALALLWAV
ncbi:MAG: hypothetical protein R3D90_15505 [Paracoccaceae bacterium]